MKPKYRWIFWDNDGVLVDTEELYFRANQEILATIDIDLTRERFTRISMQEGRSTFILAREKGIDPKTLQQLHTRRNIRYSELLKQGVPVMDRVHETLQQLAGKVSMGVVTSCRRIHFDLIHQSTHLLKYFDFVITTEDVRHTKPDPEPYLKALAKTGCKPSECLVVEDAERGLAAAKAAGIPCVVIPNGFTSQGEFRSAHRILDGIHQVVDEVLG
jgi:HAD superfamily hydrolase (TIGR01509 family)